MKIFIPKMYQKNIFIINYNKLKQAGIKLLIFDLDNTLGSIDETVINEDTSNFLTNLATNFQIVIASNSKKKRVSKFCSGLNIPFYTFSLKPTKKSFIKIKNDYNLDYNKMAIIGDQILTDIFGGNRLGIYTILVDPLDIDFKVSKINRLIEKKINLKNGIIRGNYYEKD